MSVQVLHCSDTHLDKTFNISNLVRAQQRKDDINNNFSNAVTYALKNKPDLFLITGDVFDKLSPGNSARVFLTQKIRQLKEANISVLMIGGNHEVPKFGSQHLAIDVLAHAGLATVFSRSDAIEKQVLEIDGKRVCVSGKSYFSQLESTNPLRGHSVPVDGDYNILMIHGSLQGLNVTSSVPEFAFQNPFRTYDISKGLDYLAMGHFHNHYEREHEDCKIVNPGSVEKLSWAEISDEKGFVWAEIHGSETSTEFIRLETRQMEEYVLNLSKSGDYSPTIRDYVIKFLNERADSSTLVRLSLSGQITQEQHNQLKINEIFKAAGDKFFHLVLDRRDLDIEGFGRVFAERVDNPVEAFTKRLDRLIAETGDQGKKTQLEQVKELGRRYLEESKT